MNTQEFLELLKEHTGKELVFQYHNDLRIGANYHITEVKNITVDAVDCGAGTDFWKETVIQLWESPAEIGKRNYMTASKALEILLRVNGMKPMEKNAVVRFEYGNQSFHTAQLYVGEYRVTANQVVLQLQAQPTACKAQEECGVQVTANGLETADCIPGNGCC